MGLNSPFGPKGALMSPKAFNLTISLHQMAKAKLLLFTYTVLPRMQNLNKNLPSSSSSFEGYPLQARHKQNWGRGFILLLPQTAALPGSDAGSDVIKPASSFVIQNRQTSCSMWCQLYRARC